MNQDTQKIDIDYVCNLARIDMGDAQKQELANELGDIVHYLDKLNTADVSDIEPMAHPFPLNNVWEADEPEACLTPEEALMNAPAKRNNQVSVPKVVE